MPASVDFADPDFTFQRSGWGTSTGKLGDGLGRIASGVRTQNVEINANSRGKATDRSIEKTTNGHKKLDAQSDILAAAAKAFSEMQCAADDYDRDAPTLAEVQTAERDMQRARKKMQETQSSSSEKDFKGAQKNLRDLRAKRSAARGELEAGDKRIATKLKALVPNSHKDHEQSGDRYGAADENDTVPSRHGTSAPPATHTSSGPVPGGKSEPSLHGPGTNKAVDDLMNKQRQGQPVQMPPQQQQPAAQQPTGPVGTPTSPTKGGSSNPLSDRDKDRDRHSSTPGLAAAAAVTPSSTSTSTAPPPATSGESKTGMQTGANVTGRSDARVNLSAGNATNATATAPGATPTTSRGGMPMAPMMGAPGGANGTQRKQTERIIQSESEAELHGINAVDDAVPGGTILQRDGESGTA